MAVTVNNDTVTRTKNVWKNTFILLSCTVKFLVSQAIKRQQYAGCDTKPTPKSEIAKLRIKMFHGVRREAVFTNVKMTRKFKIAVTIEEREFEIRRKYK